MKSNEQLWKAMKSDEKLFIGEEQTQTRELKAAARPGSEIQWLHFSPISTKPTPAVQHSAQVRYLLQPDVQLRGISAINRYRAVAAVWVSGRAWQGNIQLIGISEVGVTWAGWWPHWTLDMGNPLQLDLGNPPFALFFLLFQAPCFLFSSHGTLRCTKTVESKARYETRSSLYQMLLFVL